MKLVVYNGSPRAKQSNTKVLLEHFLKGYTSVCDTGFEMCYLLQEKDRERHLELFAEAENVIMAFPLYADSMPGIVKSFMESLDHFRHHKEMPDISFIIHSGFPEPHHCRYLERYLEKLARRLKCNYKGTVVKGGSEGIDILPAWMSRKTFNYFYELGIHFGKTTEMQPEIIKKLAPDDHNSKIRLFFMKLMMKLKLLDFYWTKQLKDNSALQKSFDSPLL